ncbi:MAG: hypothetical protein V4689_02365 [Verrucomicrobiota bacterium]
MNHPNHPFHPVIYIRGFAATQGEIEETVADPYMGFNIGSTKARQVWTGELKKFFFESPLVRLHTDHGYRDVFDEGEDLIAAERTDLPIPYRSVIIFRYYDEASKAFSDGETPPIEQFGLGLGKLILQVRDKICANPKNHVTPADFRVHLVAHSMGGLVARCFLQSPGLGTAKEFAAVKEARQLVDKVFTYATPHNGIDMRIVRNVPAWASFGEVNNFNRERMAGYLGLPAKPKKDQELDVSDLGEFPADRMFNLVGTNPGDYTVMKGLSSWAAGDDSDGLVRMHQATTHGRDRQGRAVESPRAHVFRSHSGHYGIVNSEEGYQNLTRFLFGNFRIDGILDIDEVILPAEVDKALEALDEEDRNDFKASYQFEVAVSVRNCRWQLHRRNVRENSSIFRSYEELFPKGKNGERKPDRSRSPHLFSTFLDQRLSSRTNGSVSLAFDISVLVPEYTMKGVLFFKRHYEGGSIYKQQIIIEATPDKKEPKGWRINYGFQNETPNAAPHVAETTVLDGDAGLEFKIDVMQDQKPGIKAQLRIITRPWD